MDILAFEYPRISMDIHEKMTWIWIWIWMRFFLSTASLILGDSLIYTSMISFGGVSLKFMICMILWEGHPIFSGGSPYLQALLASFEGLSKIWGLYLSIFIKL